MVKYFFKRAAVLMALAAVVIASGCNPNVTPGQDTTGPGKVTDLLVQPGSDKISLRWKNPSDADLNQVHIYVAKKADGTAVRSVYMVVKAGETDNMIVNGLDTDTEYTVTVTAIDKSGNKSAGETKPVQTTKAGNAMTLTLTQKPEETVWTKDSVTITVKPSTSIQEAKWKKGVCNTKDVLKNGTVITGNSFPVEENGIYSVAVVDKDGRREVETIEIKNIDKKPPQTPIDFTAEYKLSAKKIVLNWKAPVDTGSGLKELKLSYAINGATDKTEKTETIAKDVQTFEITNVESKKPPELYAFSLKAVDNAGNEGEEATAQIKPSEQAEITRIDVSRKKIDKNDPDKTVTVTIHGFNLTKAAAIKITGAGVTPVTLSNTTDSQASAEFTLPNTVKDTEFKVHVKHSAADAFTLVNGITTKTHVCYPARIDAMEVTRADGSKFETDNFKALKVEAGAGGFMKIILSGQNLDIDGAKAGIRFNGQDIDGSTVNEKGTELTIASVAIPTTPGTYPIEAQLKPRYEANYTKVSRSRILRVVGDITLKELILPGYKPELEDQDDGKIGVIITGENLDSLTREELSAITSSLHATVKNARLEDSFTLSAEYVFPDLEDDSVIGKTETLTIAGKTISAPLHTLHIYYSRNGLHEAYTVTGYHSIPSDGNPRIPPYVTAIGGNAFANCTDLKGALDLSSNTRLTEIGYGAFSGCTELTSVTLPESLTYIHSASSWSEKGVFSGCTKLANIDLSRCTRLTTIGSEAFNGCTKLASVDLSHCTRLTEIGNGAFKDYTGLTSIQFPASLTAIGNSAFSNCKKLASVDLSPCTRLTKIDKEAFQSCTALTSVQFPESLTTIGNSAFSGCTKLASVDLSRCTRLSEIGDGEFGGGVFSYCTKLTSVNLSGCTRLTKIPRMLFEQCKELTSIQFPESLTEIGSIAFHNCIKLASVDLSRCTRLSEIGHGAFSYCSELTSVQFPASLTTIGSQAFQYCNLTNAVFAESTGWAAYDDDKHTDKTADIQKTDLENAGTAAKYLRNDYCDKYWKKG